MAAIFIPFISELDTCCMKIFVFRTDGSLLDVADGFDVEKSALVYRTPTLYLVLAKISVGFRGFSDSWAFRNRLIVSSTVFGSTNDGFSIDDSIFLG